MNVLMRRFQDSKIHSSEFWSLETKVSIISFQGPEFRKHFCPLISLETNLRSEKDSRQFGYNQFLFESSKIEPSAATCCNHTSILGSKIETSAATTCNHLLQPYLHTWWRSWSFCYQVTIMNFDSWVNHGRCSNFGSKIWWSYWYLGILQPSSDGVDICCNLLPPFLHTWF